MTLISNPSECGSRASVLRTVSRSSGTTVRLTSLVLAGVRAAMRNVVWRSVLTNVDSPMVRTEMT